MRITTTGFQGAPGVTTIYYRKRSALDWESIKGFLVGQVSTAYNTIKPLCPTSWHYSISGSIDIVNAESGHILDLLTTTDITGSGTASGGFTPSASGLRVQWNTLGFVNGRRVRGATFLVPVYAASVDTDGTPTFTALGFAQNFADAMCVSNGYGQLVVWKRPHPGTTDGMAVDAVSGSIKDTFAVLRSRRD
jgi:hypothetical protein